MNERQKSINTDKCTSGSSAWDVASRWVSISVSGCAPFIHLSLALETGEQHRWATENTISMYNSDGVTPEGVITSLSQEEEIRFCGNSAGNQFALAQFRQRSAFLWRSPGCQTQLASKHKRSIVFSQQGAAVLWQWSLPAYWSQGHPLTISQRATADDAEGSLRCAGSFLDVGAEECFLITAIGINCLAKHPHGQLWDEVCLQLRRTIPPPPTATFSKLLQRAASRNNEFLDRIHCFQNLPEKLPCCSVVWRKMLILLFICVGYEQ